jgi:hypothetical protein
MATAERISQIMGSSFSRRPLRRRRPVWRCNMVTNTTAHRPTIAE